MKNLEIKVVFLLGKSVLLSMMVSLSTLYLVPLWSTVNGCLPLLALPFFQGRIYGHRCETLLYYYILG